LRWEGFERSSEDRQAQRTRPRDGLSKLEKRQDTMRERMEGGHAWHQIITEYL